MIGIRSIPSDRTTDLEHELFVVVWEVCQRLGQRFRYVCPSSCPGRCQVPTFSASNWAEWCGASHSGRPQFGPRQTNGFNSCLRGEIDRMEFGIVGILVVILLVVLIIYFIRRA